MRGTVSHADNDFRRHEHGQCNTGAIVCSYIQYATVDYMASWYSVKRIATVRTGYFAEAVPWPRGHNQKPRQWSFERKPISISLHNMTIDFILATNEVSNLKTVALPDIWDFGTAWTYCTVGLIDCAFCFFFVFFFWFPNKVDSPTNSSISPTLFCASDHLQYLPGLPGWLEFTRIVVPFFYNDMWIITAFLFVARGQRQMSQTMI